MPLQSAKNVKVRFLTEVTYNTPPGTDGAEQLRFVPSPGLTLKSTTIRSNEQRADALQTMGRNGSETVDGSYSCEMSPKSHRTLYQAVMRGTWRAPLVLDESDFTSLTTPTTSTIVRASGSWIDDGICEGDLLRIHAQATSLANNDKNLRIKTVTDLTLTTYGAPLVVNAAADTDCAVVVPAKLTNPADGPTKRTLHFEQQNVDILGSQLFGGVRVIGMKITGTPDGMALVEFTCLGASMDTKTGGDSPYFLTAETTVYTTDPLVFSDAKISVDGTDIAVATAFEITLGITAATQPVVGSKTSPDVFDNDMQLAGTFSMIRKDFANVVAFRNETEMKLHVLLTLPTAEPKAGIALYVPRIKFTDAAAPLGGDGPMIEGLPFQTGAQAEGIAKDATQMTMFEIDNEEIATALAA